MKKIFSFLFICLLSVSSIFLMGCDLNSLLGNESNETYDDILLPSAKKAELEEDGYSVTIINTYKELDEASELLNNIIYQEGSNSDALIEDGFLTAIVVATKVVDEESEELAIYYCKDVKTAEIVKNNLEMNFDDKYSKLEQYGYTVTIEFAGDNSSTEGGDEGQGRDYDAAVDTVCNDLESNGWVCEIVDEKADIQQITQQLGLTSYKLTVLVIANKVNGATITSILVIFAENSDEASKIADAINKSGFEKDSLDVKGADIYVTVNQQLDDNYFEGQLTQEGYENIEKLDAEALAGFISTFNLNEGDVLGFVIGERVYPQDTSKEESVSYVICKDETIAQNIYDQLQQEASLIVTKEGNLLIITELIERTPLDVELERLQSNGYTIDSVVEPNNDVVGLLYDSSIRFGFEDTAFSFIINASKDATENNKSYFYHYIIYGCLNAEYATVAFEKGQELYPDDLVSMQDLSVLVFHKEPGLDAALNAQYPQMAQDKLLMEQNGWTCEIVELDSELNSFLNIVNNDEGVDLTNKVFGYMRFTHPDYALPFDVYYCKDARTVNSLYAYFATLPTYRVDTNNPMKDNVGQSVDHLLTMGPKDAHYILMGSRTN